MYWPIYSALTYKKQCIDISGRLFPKVVIMLGIIGKALINYGDCLDGWSILTLLIGWRHMVWVFQCMSRNYCLEYGLFTQE